MWVISHNGRKPKMCLSCHMCFELISGFSYAHGHLAFMVWPQRGYRVCVWCLVVRELAMWSVSGCMTGVQILKGSLLFRLHRSETGCCFCAVSCPVLSGDRTVRQVPAQRWYPSTKLYGVTYQKAYLRRREGLTSRIIQGFCGFLPTLQENCRLISCRQYGRNWFLSGTFFACFQVSATRCHIFVLLVCYAACNC